MISVLIEKIFKPHHFKTVDELVEAYKPMLEWLAENIKGAYRLRSLDNSAYSELNEDLWIGYIVEFGEETDAMAFKLRWGGR